jgi:hypothetical protein
VMEKENSQGNSASGIKYVVLGLGGCLVYIAIAIGGLVLLIMFLRGTPWIAENFYPWTVQAAKITLYFVIPTCSVLAFFRKGRGLGGLGLSLSSYVIGFSLWVWSLIVAYSLGGVFWIIVGLLFAGVGVIPIAIVAAALKAQWSIAGQMLLGLVVVLALRAIGTSLVENDARRDIPK